MFSVKLVFFIVIGECGLLIVINLFSYVIIVCLVSFEDVGVFFVISVFVVMLLILWDFGIGFYIVMIKDLM